MFEQLLGGLMSDESKAEKANDLMSSAMILLAKEYNLDHTEIAFFIRPINAEFDPGIQAVKMKDGRVVDFLRVVTMLELVKAQEAE